MKTVPFFLALALAGAPMAAQALDAALAARDASWNTLRQQADVDALERLIAPDFVLVHSDGRVQRKADYLAELRSRQRVNGPIVNQDVTIREYGAVAVVNGVSVQSAVSNGKPWSGRFRFTRVWLKQGGDWVLVSSHSSRIADAP
ncbi:nuclear transport factor 2 family protein [Massilia sp. ST3]|uniref:nuclear transport factor 2 family protein n=1 Tax=Massilia sp. ST3 TaxID=2824903 RepID=UPI001B818496|nr:nuclear transport factor 2 family protein [Massilia sp. ST3]MBQ5950077.1 nuclear transport factor 2 family protein [Massilia sp. ST3]